MEKKTKGKQRIQIQKVEDDTNLQVTFSKRKSGLFKKTSEVCTLTGAEFALIVFSPGAKVFSFGQPSVYNILNRFGYAPEPAPGAPAPAHTIINSPATLARQNARLQGLSNDLTQVSERLYNLRRRGVHLNDIRSNIGDSNWWAAPIGDLNLEQLGQVSSILENLHTNMSHQLGTIMQNSSNFHTASSSRVAQQQGLGIDRDFMPRSAPSSFLMPPPPPPRYINSHEDSFSNHIMPTLESGGFEGHSYLNEDVIPTPHGYLNEDARPTLPIPPPNSYTNSDSFMPASLQGYISQGYNTQPASNSTSSSSSSDFHFQDGSEFP